MNCHTTDILLLLLLLLLLSHVSRVQPCVTPLTAAHQAPLSLDSPGKNTGMGCHFLFQCMKVKSESEVAQLCQTLRDPMDCNLPGSSNHGIFQAMVLEELPLPSPLHIWRNLKFIWSSGGNHLKSLHIV